MSTPTGCPQPGSPPALTQVSARFMAAPLQTKLEEDAAELPNKQHLESEQEETLMMGVSGRG